MAIDRVFFCAINEIFLLPILNLDGAFNLIFFGQFSKSIRKDYKEETKVHIRHGMSMNSSDGEKFKKKKIQYFHQNENFNSLEN